MTRTEEARRRPTPRGSLSELPSGIGRELLDEAERRLEDQRFIAFTLWVLEKNARARGFYEARGFRLDSSPKEETIGGLLLTELRYEKNAEPSPHFSRPREKCARSADIRRGWPRTPIFFASRSFRPGKLLPKQLATGDLLPIEKFVRRSG